MVLVMKPSPQEIHAFCPTVPAELAAAHCARLPERYFQEFCLDEVAAHLRGLAQLSSEHPVELLIRAEAGNRFECTILAFDRPGIFALIAGLLTGSGADIHEGAVFTYSSAAELRQVHDRRRGRDEALRALRDPHLRKRIIDRFSGTYQAPLQPVEWRAGLEQRIRDLFVLLETGDAEAEAAAKSRVNELVAQQLSHITFAAADVLFPVRIDVDNNAREDCTRLHVISQDTPAFLYALSNALSLHGVSIEQVRIETRGARIQDEIDITRLGGGRITDPTKLNRIKLSVLLTKQFTYFLGNAPDPYTALARFEQLVKDVLALPEQGRWVEWLSEPLILRDLARLLGASDFLWEDFVRLQYETLIPMLRPHVRGRRFAGPLHSMSARLRKALRGKEGIDQKKAALNEFKDREIFLVDLDHILTPAIDFQALAARLTGLAELVVSTALDIAAEQMRGRYGLPRTVAGLEAGMAVFGLGKLGGAALGYASDIELLFVYDDNGTTDGPETISNAEYFNRLVQETVGCIKAKRDGIFNIDLRLRPHGKDGPLAVSLAAFCGYYGARGSAHSYERLALVRLRWLAGRRELGERVERLRDGLVYGADAISPSQIRELRERQFVEKNVSGRVNAKFSPGGLVDLEYDVEILQVMYGRERPDLRTPRLHEALNALAEAGVITPKESRHLLLAYDFLRRLINGLRMLRGSARDLFLPPLESMEFLHLARRMGYTPQPAMTPDRQLRLDFDTHTAVVRAFVERHFGPDSLPGPATGNVADLILLDQVSPALQERVLHAAGFIDPARAAVNLRRLAGEGELRNSFARLAVLACDMLSRQPDPDMALNNWERFMHEHQHTARHYYETLLSQPTRLEILLNLFSGSQFLADTLIRYPQFLEWVTDPEVLHRVRQRREVEEELRQMAAAAADYPEWLDQLRRLRRREILRIGTRDLCLNATPDCIAEELSNLADAIISVALEQVWRKLQSDGRLPLPAAVMARKFCVMAFGKLGGVELNYSSDVDLLGVFSDRPPAGWPQAADAATYESVFAAAMEQLRSALTSHTAEGYAYRVDLRLRPYGRAGTLVTSVSRLSRYYEEAAALWEVQALLKMRAVAGNVAVGKRFLTRQRRLLRQSRTGQDVFASIKHMRDAAIERVQTGQRKGVDIKAGRGSIRDVEFLVQGLQLIHLSRHPGLFTGNTLDALQALADHGIIGRDESGQLRTDYLFLRKIEHYLQLFEDRQVHTLPVTENEMSKLARRVFGSAFTAAAFLREVEACRTRVRGTCEALALAAKTSG